MSRQVIIIKEMSAGNETVGEMWKETKVFDSNDQIFKVLDWAFGTTIGNSKSFTRRRNVIITIADNETDN